MGPFWIFAAELDLCKGKFFKRLSCPFFRVSSNDTGEDIFFRKARNERIAELYKAVVFGDDLGKVKKVMFQKQELTNIEKADDGKSLKIKGLAAAGVTAVAKTQSIDLILPSGKATVKLEVVNSKVESVTK